MSRKEIAVSYLKGAAASVETYGEADTIGMLLAEMVGAACYGEGSVAEVAARLEAAVDEAKEF